MCLALDPRETDRCVPVARTPCTIVAEERRPLLLADLVGVDSASLRELSCVKNVAQSTSYMSRTPGPHNHVSRRVLENRQPYFEIRRSGPSSHLHEKTQKESCPCKRERAQKRTNPIKLSDSTPTAQNAQNVSVRRCATNAAESNDAKATIGRGFHYNDSEEGEEIKAK
jgi:hypothetical protein